MSVGTSHPNHMTMTTLIRMVLVLVPGLMIGCDGSVGVRGLVMDPSGTPITSGNVTLARPGDAAGFKTAVNDNGCFNLGGLVAPGSRDYFLTINSEGYQPLEGTVKSAGDYAVNARLSPTGAESPSDLEILNTENPDSLNDCHTDTITSTAAARSHWQCTNDIEVQCASGQCDASTGDDFTPMSITADESGELQVCAYSGCWKGKADTQKTANFLVLTGNDLPFTSGEKETSDTENIAVTIDLNDGIGTVKAGAFAQPLLCRVKH